MSRRQWLLSSAIVFLSIAGAGMSYAGDDRSRVRWDIVSIDFAAGTVGPGGIASADAADGSKITLTGSGRFSIDDDDSDGAMVSGRGTWRTFDPAGVETGRGTYRVTGLVDWDRAPGDPPPLKDLIRGEGEASAGLAVLRIRYSDRTEGILVISCHLVGTPDSVVEGITATKSFVDYYDANLPEPGVDANRTLFHVRQDEENN